MDVTLNGKTKEINLMHLRIVLKIPSLYNSNIIFPIHHLKDFVSCFTDFCFY